MLVFLELFFDFFKIGLFAVGGGLATLPFLMDLASQHPEWLTMQDVSNMIAISESTPGPMGINMATYVGNNVGTYVLGSPIGGVLGGVIATLGEVLPSIIIIMIVAGFLQRFKSSTIVRFAFYGLRATVIALISYAAYQVYRVSLFRGNQIRWPEIALFAILLFCMQKFKKIHPVVWIAIAAVIGIVSSAFLGYSFV